MDASYLVVRTSMPTQKRKAALKKPIEIIRQASIAASCDAIINSASALRFRRVGTTRGDRH